MAIRYRGARQQKLLSIVGASALILAACDAPSPIVSFRASSSGETPSVVSGQSSASRRTPDDSALQVTIEPGTTSTLLEGTLDAGTEAEFVISAEGGSVLMASVVGATAEVLASVYRIDTGEEIPDAAPDQSFWIARVPETVGYLIVLQSRGVATDFRLTVGTPSDSFLDMLQFSTDVADIDSSANDTTRTQCDRQSENAVDVSSQRSPTCRVPQRRLPRVAAAWFSLHRGSNMRPLCGSPLLSELCDLAVLVPSRA